VLLIDEIDCGVGWLIAAVFSPREVKPFALFVAVFSSLRSSAAAAALNPQKREATKANSFIPLGGRKPATHHNSSARPLGRAS